MISIPRDQWTLDSGCNFNPVSLLTMTAMPTRDTVINELISRKISARTTRPLSTVTTNAPVCLSIDVAAVPFWLQNGLSSTTTGTKTIMAQYDDALRVNKRCRISFFNDFDKHRDFGVGWKNRPKFGIQFALICLPASFGFAEN